MREYLNNPSICKNMPEAEPKITVQAKQHLQMHKHVQNPAKDLKLSKKERLAKINYSLELFPKKITKLHLTGM